MKNMMRPWGVRKKREHPGLARVVPSGHTYIECPDCGRHDIYSRSKTLDFVCKKCGKVFTRKAPE